MKHLILLTVLCFIVISPVLADAKVGHSMAELINDVRAELNVETLAVRQIDQAFVFRGQVQVSFFDPAGFDLDEITAAVLTYKTRHDDADQVVPLQRFGKGKYLADIILVKNGQLQFQVTMFTADGSKKSFDFKYMI